MNSCEYKFSEDFYVDIAVPDANSTIDLGLFTENPVLFEPTTISYQYNGQDNQELRQVAAYIDDNLVNYFHDSSDGIPVNTDNLSEGEHVLKIVYTFSSGSGSIADLSHGETYTKTEEYRFTVDKSAPEEVVLTKVEVIDGSIFVFWNPISSNNFTEVILRVQDPESYRNIEEFELSAEDMASGSFNDRVNTTFQLDYSIVLTNRYSESNSNTLNLTLEEPSFGSEIIDNSQYKIFWGEHPLYGNFDFYHYSVRPDFEIIEVSNRGGELIVDDIPVFGQTSHHSLSLRRNDEFSSFGYAGGVPTFGKPFEQKYCNSYMYNPNNDTFYVLEIEKGLAHNASKDIMIHKLNGDDLSLIQTTVIGNTIHAYPDIAVDEVTGNLIVDMVDKSLLLDSNSLTEINSWEASSYANDGVSYKTAYRNGIVILRSLGQVYFYDEQSKVLIHQLASTSQHFKFSNDARFFYNEEAIYEINNGVVTQITTTYEEKPVFGIEFLGNQNKIAYFETHQNPIIYDVTTGTKTTLHQLADVRAINLDPKTGNLMFYNKFYEQIQHQHNVSTVITAYVHIVDPNSTQIQSLRVNEDFYSNNFKFLNSKLILESGLYLDNYFN